MITYDISPHITGDTWEGLGTLTFTRNGSAVNLTGASAYMEVKKAFNVAAPDVLNLTTANSGLIIVSPLSGLLAVPPRIVDIPVGMYQWSITIVLQSGEKLTDIMGTWPIIPKIPFYLNQNVYDHYQMIE